uniref:Reverse transcriptase domain-containing protein n=1 Tax=Tanacetum cinerariifolium TaxID=118510 RepID=A0A6L2LKE4_TANCI|nr:hypothetical protein [Tanacetum cinerariifolium]
MFSLVWIMPPRVMTQSAGRPAAASRGGGGTGKRVGSESRRVREPKRRNVEPTCKPEGQGNDQSVKVNEGVDGEFLVCTPKECDGKGSTIVYTRWIEKMEFAHEAVRLLLVWHRTNLRAGHAAYTDRFYELTRMLATTEPTMIQSVVLKAGVLTDDAIRNGSIKKNPKKRRNGREPSIDRNMKDKNKRTRI